MTDQNSQFFAMLTAVGEAKQANADALGIAWKITHMSVGDANGTEPIPNRLQTTLLNERRRAPLNQLKVDPNNTSILIAEQVIPEDVGGFWIREVGLHDEAGDLVAIANCAPSYKPQMSQGSGRTQVVRMNFIVSSAANVELKIDPSVVLATRKYVDDELAKLDHKQSVRYATTAPIALAGLAVQAGGDWAAALTAGDRVLVKNQAAGKDNGLYAAAAGAWLRVADADGSPEVTSGLVVAVEQGTTLADTRWQLVTDGAIVLGTTALVFQDVTQGFAPLASPALTGVPIAPTAAPATNTPQLATTAFVQAAVGVGHVGMFAMSAAPAGWLKANGAAVSRAAYAELFAAIGTTFGVGNGITTFNLPDLRGEFARGWDDGRGIDIGRAFGSAQADAIQNITGSFIGSGINNSASGAFQMAVQDTGDWLPTAGTNRQDTISFDASRVVRAAAETRSRNIALLMCIKY